MFAPKRMSIPKRMGSANAPTMFPHTVTMYNVTVETDKTSITSKITKHITVLCGVLLEATKAVNVRESGLESADSVSLIIPFCVEATDGITGKKKKYVPPVEFWRSDDKSGLWTLAVSAKDGSTDGNTFFIKGKVVEPDLSIEAIEMMYDHVYDITKVDEMDYGGLAHWEVGAV